jgi:hypothetical protein
MYDDRNSQPSQSSKVTACCYCAACICSLSSCRDGCTQLASVSKTFYLLLRHHPRQASVRPRPRPRKKWGPGQVTNTWQIGFAIASHQSSFVCCLQCSSQESDSRTRMTKLICAILLLPSLTRMQVRLFQASESHSVGCCDQLRRSPIFPYS